MPLPTSSPTIVAPPDLAAGLEDWLTAGRLPLPTGFRIVARIALEAAELRVPEGAAIYATEELHCRSEPDGSLTVYWLPWGARGRIHPTAPEVDLVVSDAALAQGGEFYRRFLINVVILALKRAGLYHLHAATARDPQGEGWVLTGDSCCGKSTTSALLARRGWAVGTDDMSFLHHQDGACVVTAWRSLIALRQGGQALLNSIGGTPIPERGKQGYYPEELGGTWVQTIRPRYLLFPQLGGEGSWLEPIPASEVLRLILPWSFWVLFETWGAEDYMSVLKNLASQTTAFRLHLAPDLMDRPGALRDLLPLETPTL